MALLSAEDDLNATILPRLDAAAAMERVAILRGALTRAVETGREWQRPFPLPQDIPLLEETIQEKVAKLLVIDPLFAYLDAKVNSWRDQDARAAGIASDAFVRSWREARLIKRRIGFNTSAHVVWKLPENANSATASTFLSTMPVLEQFESMHKNAADAQEHEEREESAEQEGQEEQDCAAQRARMPSGSVRCAVITGARMNC